MRIPNFTVGGRQRRTKRGVWSREDTRSEWVDFLFTVKVGVAKGDSEGTEVLSPGLVP